MDWIKVETNTPEKPEIKKLARDCRVDNATAFLAWFRLWRYLDATTDDGLIPHLTMDDCDDEARLPGIGQVMADVHWIEFTDAGALVMNWDRHNGRSAKSRALHAVKQAEYRKKPGNDNGYRPWKKRA